MAPFERRLAWALRAARWPYIRVSDIERRLGSTRTATTLKRLRALFPGLRFVWIMGADNLVQVSEWANWTEIFATVPVAVFDRPSYSERAMASEAARRFAKYRVDAGRKRTLAERRPPAWIFFPGRLMSVSGTGIRVRCRQAGRRPTAVFGETWERSEP